MYRNDLPVLDPFLHIAGDMREGDLSAEWEATKAKIKTAVVALGSRTHDDASLDIEDLITGKGFQFLRMPGQPITLLLPLKGLNAEELIIVLLISDLPIWFLQIDCTFYHNN